MKSMHIHLYAMWMIYNTVFVCVHAYMHAYVWKFPPSQTSVMDAQFTQFIDL